MELKESYITHTLEGRPFFWKELPKDFIVTRFQYNPHGCHLTIWYIYSEENKKEFTFEVYGDRYFGRTEGKYLGFFQHGNLTWRLYVK